MKTLAPVLLILALFLVAHADLNSSANSAAVIQSGVWTMQPGNTANTTPWLYQFPASNSNVIIAAATTAVKATAGTLRRITVTTEVASATIKLFDLASASCTGTPSTNPKAVITLPATISNPFTIEFQQSFANGICALTSGATNLTVIYD
jgi:hypothetical protein